MGKLQASILKDLRLLLRDKVGLILMFGMPVLLVLVITSLQNNTFKIVNDHQIPMVIFNQDRLEVSLELENMLRESGMFKIQTDTEAVNTKELYNTMKDQDALVGLYIPQGFSKKLISNAQSLTDHTLSSLGVGDDLLQPIHSDKEELDVFYSPVLQESYRLAVEGALQSAMRIIQSRKMLNLIFYSLSESDMPEDLEQQMMNEGVKLNQQTLTSDGGGAIPNATQHNVPAWTIFAMFFMVTSLGSSLVREKQSGSFIRLKTMPGGYLTGVFSKQLVYVLVALLQVFVIFSIGIFIFPHIGLPALQLPDNIIMLLLVSVISGWCAVSYALCLGIFSSTEEQTNGFGAVSIVILAALGGILVPVFAMPDSFRIFTSISPLYWCLQSYYELFLDGGRWSEVLWTLLPVLAITGVLQLAAFTGLKKKNLI